jgi:hypothetical protein
MTTAVIKMCTTLLVLKVFRHPILPTRKLGYIQPKTALNYKDTACARMEEERQPRRTARMKKLNLK